MVCSFCGNLSALESDRGSSRQTAREGNGLSKKRTLADVALASGNAEEAYRYYSESLEEDPTDADAWFGKAASALAMSTLANFRVREAIVGFEQALKFVPATASRSILESACNEMVSACKAFDSSSYSHFLKFVQLENSSAEFDARRMLVNEGFLWVATKTPEREDFDKEFLVVTGSIYFMHKKNGAASPLLVPLEQRHAFLRERIMRRDSSFKGANLQDIEKATNPCFVVTAAAGSANHPAVVELRHFRDDYLASFVAGRFACRIYSVIGPILARAISRHGTLQELAFRFFVAPMLLMSRMLHRESASTHGSLPTRARRRLTNLPWQGSTNETHEGPFRSSRTDAGPARR
jgi:hypothetical protein